MIQGVIHGYQVMTNARPSPCRYVPSCSAYADEAVQVHGAIKGGAMSLRRLSRCHPWGASGWDPVPDIHGNCAPEPVSSSRDDLSTDA